MLTRFISLDAGSGGEPSTGPALALATGKLGASSSRGSGSAGAAGCGAAAALSASATGARVGRAGEAGSEGLGFGGVGLTPTGG